MEVNVQITKDKQFRAFYMFFIVSSTHLGVGMIGTPRIVFDKAGHDAWISIILAYLFVLLVLSTMLFILSRYESSDILGIHADIFGTFISKLIGIIYIVYFGAHILSTLITYVEIVNVFIFPNLEPLLLGFMLLTLIIYSSVGGLKVIVGVVFLFCILSNWIILMLYQPLTQMDFHNFLPVMDTDLKGLLLGMTSTAYTFMGFEILFFIYPFVRNKKNIRVPILLGTTWATFIVLLTTITAIGFLSPGQLERRIWPVMNLFKLQTTPIIERLDYIVVAEWMMVTVPRMILLMWGITYIAKRLFKTSTKLSLYLTSGILFALIPLFREHFDIQQLIDTVRNYGMWLVYVYPFILLPLVLFKKRKQKKKKGVPLNAE
ncbi:GerAB/ArcD/ProY family transporter [Oceanobacillus sp. CAU 1775]